MKKAGVLCALCLGCALPLFAELRLDLGFDIPRGVGGVVENQMDVSEDAADFFDRFILPFPEAGLYYQHPFPWGRVGAGARLFTFILESIFWPNAYVEADLWRFTFALQAGGGIFGMFGLYNALQTGAVFIPDASAWFRIGKSFRLGAGAIGFMLPEQSSDIAFVYYLGGKVALTF